MTIIYGYKKGEGIRPITSSPHKLKTVNVATATAGQHLSGKARCTVEGCDKVFQRKHLAANHIRARHPEVLGDEKDSWKDFVEEV